MGKANFDFTGGNCLVTGASSGMGRDAALRLAKAGANVLAVARREERLRELAALDEKITPLVVDVKDTEAIKAGAEAFIAKHGKLNGLVHAAGINAFTPLKTYDEDLAHEIMEVSFWAGIRLVRLLHKKKYSEDGASFVLFSSTYASSGMKSVFAYAAAKAAVANAVKSLAGELAPRKIRLNAILPGGVETEMTEAMPLGDAAVARCSLGLGQPENVSGAVMFLLSDEAKWITGTNLVVDGGYLAN